MILTRYGESRVALSMIARGQHFFSAGAMLSQKGGNGYVTRHLLCQGAELILKGLLLLGDFPKYWPLLKVKFNHRLLRLADEVADLYSQPKPAGALRAELVMLDRLYRSHHLRYASGMDLLINPETIADQLVTDRLLALVVLTKRAVRSAGLVQPSAA